MNGNLPKIGDCTYAITICPKPMYYANTYNAELLNTIDVIRGAMKYSIDYVLYVELTIEGHIHYHGWFNIKDKIKYYKKTLPTLKRLGFIKIKSRVDEGWMKYCLKDQEVMRNTIALPVRYLNKDKRLITKAIYESQVQIDYGIKAYLLNS